MNTKFLLAVVAATLLSFFGGWALWGIALDGYYSANITDAGKALQRADEDMVYWALIAAQIAWAFLLTWIIDRSNSHSAMKGAVTGAVLSMLVAASFNFMMYAMMDMHTGAGILVADILLNGAFTAVIGGVVGWILGRGQ